MYLICNINKMSAIFNASSPLHTRENLTFEKVELHFSLYYWKIHALSSKLHKEKGFIKFRCLLGGIKRFADLSPQLRSSNLDN